jgi:hypothetical protein
MASRSAPAGLTALAALLLNVSAAHALWTHDISVNQPISVMSGYQSEPVAMADGQGGAFVAWQDTRPPGGGTKIYMQRIDANGSPQWTANGIPVMNLATNPFVGIAGMVPDGAGGVILGWSDYRSAGFHVFAQRISGAGAVQWQANGVPVCLAAGTQVLGGIVSDGAGGAILGWTDSRAGSFTDIYTQRLNGSGAAVWTANGVPVCTAASTQYAPVLDTDGAGGAILCWRDQRGTFDEDLYAQRVNSAGTPQWTADGIVVSNSINDQTSQCLVSDGTGGVIVAWSDARNGGWDLYAQHLTGTGSALWFYTGLAISTAAGDQTLPALAADGLGGAYLSWIDSQAGENDVHIQHYSGTGVPQYAQEQLFSAHATTLASVPAANGVISTWTYDLGSGLSVINTSYGFGSGFSTASNQQLHPAIVSDGRNGVILIWDDTRNGDEDVFAQRLDAFGFPGDASPVITSIADIPNDQGGSVRVTWQPGWIDIGYISSYRLWRSVPTLAIAGATSLHREMTRDADEAVATGRLWAGPDAAAGYAWEFVASIPDSQPAPPSYSLVAPTAYDSIPSANPLTTFMVQAVRGQGTIQNWTSAPASGYSVDNLAPAIPSPLTGTYAAGTTRLHWNPNGEADLAGYRIYRGATPDFAVGPASQIAAKPDTGFADNAGSPLYYKVTAVDIHGNESLPAAYPNGNTAAGDLAEPSFVLDSPRPNPARASSTIRYALPREALARLELFDTSGRRVRVMQDGVASAGTHVVSFPLADAAGRPLPSGLYLVRLESAGLAMTRRVAVVR